MNNSLSSLVENEFTYIFFEIDVNMYNLCYADLAKIKQKEYLKNKVHIETKKNVIT